ncbi:SDR family NAD(P)-dependent oxidoreductase [Streptomyces sp. 35G-GA-8]|uniref:SDR family NAD(P)-dependent oxidoreductase n=1 Tax=Streptomyces sp. 35G-GA-8 TaxID=2939434 RepID=UPI00201F881E|nr:SDR family oxidoreductase [Streptomyces sp. 35G-GA-8]MCL7380572.1 SDR family oxidoreductase [Streptomyces sp. 35G-GA-8]
MTTHTPGRVALITGGGTGIGRATACQLAEAGWRVIVAGRREAPLAELAAEHPAIDYRVADIADQARADRLVEEAAAAHGRLDALVNNAGALSPLQLSGLDAQALGNLFAINVFAPSYLVSAAVKHLSASGGSIVNVSSAVAQRPNAQGAFYGASKAAVDYLTRSWAAGLAEQGIRVNAVSPGPTETPILSSVLPPEAVEAVKAREAASLPLKRRGTADEVARWIVALADPASAWVTGQVIAVDGGMAVA